MAGGRPPALGTAREAPQTLKRSDSITPLARPESGQPFESKRAEASHADIVRIPSVNVHDNSI